MIGAMLIIISIIITYWFASLQLYTPKPSIHDIGIERLLPVFQQYQQAIWSLFMIVEAFSFAVGLLTHANLQRVRRQEVEAERDRAVIKLYKAQIKPHFMFNTLNSLYGLFLTKNENALISLERFISMMRYIHTSSQLDFVSLKEEVDYINQYVGLQKLRLNEMTTVELEINIENDTLKIPPMLLVTFVENCFKHGISPVERSRIIISLKEQNGKMEFFTSNHIFPVKRIGEHMGIENCQKRLNLFYKEKHNLYIMQEENTYVVKLNIDLSI